jgi:hypothetical protein
MFSKSLKRLFPSESPIAFGSAETADKRGRVSITDLDSVATKETFNEADYLAANADVARDVERGIWKTGRAHFDRYGHSEARSLRRSSLIHAARAQKLEKILPLLNMEMPHVRRGDKFDFLSDELRAETGISDTDNVASNNYDGYIETLIESVPDGLILDCGAGKRRKYYSNVLNYEIVDYDTTDVVGVGEAQSCPICRTLI